MIFNTWTFAAFCLCTFLVYWFLVPPRWRSTVLLIASYLFFAFHYPWHTLLIFFMTVVVYMLSLFIFQFHSNRDREVKVPWYRRPKTYLIAIIVFCVGILSYYKYLRMAISSLNGILHFAGIEVTYANPSIVVPLGISFFVFEFIHYAVDAYSGTAKRVNFFRFAVFIMYFPTLVSGPIKRYQIFIDQMFEMKKFKIEYLGDGLGRILIGLGKKVIIADHMTSFATPLLHPSTASVPELWLGMYAYAMKIYFDFSGYSDIAIGSARLFGYSVPENFNYPYLQKNIAKFWNNWHMSLSSWIRDYVYIPLGGNRQGPRRAAINSLIAMGISGLWHGAAWHFVAWGLYHGIGLVWMRFWGKWKRDTNKPQFLASVTIGTSGLHAPKIRGFRDFLAILITFQFVCFGWILFYCPSINVAFQVFEKML